ncbi:hypothetical protein B9Z55_028650 [Caenorhabditis nigoni]|uniref:PH domain-containing protein n=1 Tax=Caenorhabditis nigoni TaxID=1611254 RepID=A0A2G5SAJ2_9PELO|nr:hypothetical protein B9Z55_028650 [Caenorhabditis nigoni]
MDVDGIPKSSSTQSQTRRKLLETPAKGPGILHASQIRFRGTLRKPTNRYCVVRDNFCLYTYLSDEDETALAMLPLPGCEVKIGGEKFTFSVRVGARRKYTFTAQDEEDRMKWMAVLDQAANAHLTNQRKSGSQQSD